MSEQAIGSRVKELRERRGLSQTDLAIEVGIEPNYVSQIESGKKTPSLPTLMRIAEVLGTTPSELLATGRPTRREPSASELLRDLERALERERERERHSLFAQGGFEDLTEEEREEVQRKVEEIRARRQKP